MPRGFHPVLLILALAPASVGALGLGDIHVDSALNEPLSAQIDIVSASLDDLTDLRASIASLETFQHYGAERPAYLNSATFKIGRDAEGRPVLNVRSHESFTDPLVSFLVDLRWRNSELVREYSLLLDPAGLSASRRAAASTAVVDLHAPTASVPAAASPPPTASLPAPAVSAPTVAGSLLHRITSRDTLRVIVRHAGARSETQVRRMMIATFRANPNAFDGNINRLHRGVVLNLPTSAEVDAISPADAKHAVDEQMKAWRTGGRYFSRPASTAALPAPIAPTAPTALTTYSEAPAVPAVPAVTAAAPSQSDAALTNRLHSLEQQLVDLHQQMAKESANIQELKQAAIQPGPALSPTSAAPAQPDRTRAPMSLNNLLVIGAFLLGAALAIYGYLRRRLQRPAPQDETPIGAGLESAPISASAESVTPARAESSPVVAPAAPLRPAAPAVLPQWPPVTAADTGKGMTIEVDTEALERSYLESLGFNTSAIAKNPAATGEFNFAQTPAESATATLESIAPTVKPAAVIADIDMSDLFETEVDATEVNTAVIRVDATTKVIAAPDAAASSVTTELDFNLSDLDATAQHVQMPSELNDRAEVSEGRTNIVDVLKMAIDRDPHRRDLRMKLVETYYNAATGNRRAFMEVVRKLAREREYMSAEEWSKVVRMGRDLVPDDILFTDLVKDEDDVAA